MVSVCYINTYVDLYESVKNVEFTKYTKATNIHTYVYFSASQLLFASSCGICNKASIKWGRFFEYLCILDPWAQITLINKLFLFIKKRS